MLESSSIVTITNISKILCNDNGRCDMFDDALSPCINENCDNQIEN